LFRPEAALAPRGPAFGEPWQAQALALADAMVRAGAATPEAWSAALGAALRAAEARGAPDDEATYYACVVAALEAVTADAGLVTPAERAARRAAWEDAYRRTPHGAPVTLEP